MDSLVTKSCINRVLTCEEHVSRVGDHGHWIPDEILPHFDPSHLSVAKRDQEIQNCHKYRTLHYTKRKRCVRHVTDMCHMYGTMPIRLLVKFFPILTPHTCL